MNFWRLVLVVGLLILISLCGIKTPLGEINIGDVVRLISGVLMTVTGFKKGIIKGKRNGGGNIEVSKSSIKEILE